MQSISSFITWVDPNADKSSRMSFKPLDKNFCSCWSTKNEQGGHTTECPKFSSAQHLKSFLSQDLERLDPESVLKQGHDGPSIQSDGWCGPFPIDCFFTDLKQTKSVGASDFQSTGTNASGPDSDETTGLIDGSGSGSEFNGTFADSECQTELNRAQRAADDSPPCNPSPNRVSVYWTRPQFNNSRVNCDCVEVHTCSPLLLETSKEAERSKMVSNEYEQYYIDRYDCQSEESESCQGSTLRFVRKEQFPTNSENRSQRWEEYLRSQTGPNKAKMVLSGRNEDGSLKGLIWVLP